MDNRIREKRNIAVIIPALNPIPELVNFVIDLGQCGIPRVIVVNDGSDSACDDIFEKLGKLEHCTVLVHKVNRGKGRALKTAFTHFLRHYSYLDGVVTADADGQHAIEDICNIGDKLSTNKNSLILGVRNFKEDNVPRRSYLGNRLTSRIFHFLYGCYLDDTQTGLRGIPTGELTWISEVKGESYDYEINVLIQSVYRKLEFLPVPIKTLYFNNNAGSHFKTVRDSVRIFKCLISGLFKNPGLKYCAFRILRFLYRIFTRRYKVCVAQTGEQPESDNVADGTHKVKPDAESPGIESIYNSPMVYIVHHQNLKGPIISTAWLHTVVRPWVLNVFCSRKGCFRQYYGYTFTKRFGWPKPLAAVTSFVLSFIVSGIMKAVRAIPVFRGSKAIVHTFRQSVAALAGGESILICPDIDYTDTSSQMGEMYSGFLELEKFYLRQTGRHLAFVPVRISSQSHRIYLGKPLYFNSYENSKSAFAEEKERVLNRLKVEFSNLEKMK